MAQMKTITITITDAVEITDLLLWISKGVIHPVMQKQAENLLDKIQQYINENQNTCSDTIERGHTTSVTSLQDTP
jgi:molybdopterin-guanine dinucleotide biosynthesis protein A